MDLEWKHRNKFRGLLYIFDSAGRCVPAGKSRAD